MIAFVGISLQVVKRWHYTGSIGIIMDDGWMRVSDKKANENFFMLHG